MTKATRLAQLRPTYTAQLNSLVQRKGKIPKSSTSCTDALRANNYPSDIISNILNKKLFKPPTHAIPSSEELVCMFFKWAAPQEHSNSYAVLPFINGVTQPQTRILRRHEIQVINKPFKTFQQEEFPSPKFRPSIKKSTERGLQNTLCRLWLVLCRIKTYSNSSNIAKHAWSFDHRIDFDNSSVMLYLSSKHRNRIVGRHILNYDLCVSTVIKTNSLLI